MVQNMPYKNLCSFLIFHIMLLHSLNNEFHNLYQYRPEHSLGKNKVAWKGEKASLEVFHFNKKWQNLKQYAGTFRRAQTLKLEEWSSCCFMVYKVTETCAKNFFLHKKQNILLDLSILRPFLDLLYTSLYFSIFCEKRSHYLQSIPSHP